MNILWTHNFDTSINKNAGVFMFLAAKGLIDMGVRIELEYLGDLRSVTNLNSKKNYIRKISNKFDIVHAQYGSACALVTSYVESRPKLLSLRGSDWNLYTQSYGYNYWHTKISKFMTGFSMRNYDKVITVSDRMAVEVKAEYKSINVKAIPSPIDLTKFVPMDKCHARELLGYSNNNEKWVLFNSQDINNSIKRYSLAKKSVDIANAKIGNIKIKVANNLSHSDIPLFVAACDLILCTSEYEGWPNSIKEALACNLPFVSTDVSDLKEIAAKEPTCRICPPQEEILAENICDVLSLPRSVDLRKHVISMSLENSCNKLLKIYNNLM